MKLTAKDAWNIRRMGLRLPENREYTDEDVLDIAKRQARLLEEHKKLDEQLQRLAEA